MKLELFLFRHGALQTKKNILCGWLNLPLGKEGERQASILAKKLSKENIDVGFCSDLIRSQQVMIKVLKNKPMSLVVIDPRLRERHFGALSGELESIFADTSTLQKVNGGFIEGVPGLESMHVIRQRLFPFMNDLLRFMQREKVNVAISAHKESLMLIQEYLEGLTPDQAEKLKHHPTEFKKYIIEFD